jgi:hypothetical protein
VNKLRGVLAFAVGIVTMCASAPLDAQASPWEVVYQLPHPIGPRSLRLLWASGPNDIHAIGYRTAAHYDGESWSVVPDHAQSGVQVLVGSGPADVYAIGSNETVERWDGHEWRLEHEDLATGLRRGLLRHAFVISPGVAFAATDAGDRDLAWLARRPDGSWIHVHEDEVPDSVRHAWPTVAIAPPTGCRGETVPLLSPLVFSMRCHGSIWLYEGETWTDLGIHTPRTRGLHAFFRQSSTELFVTLENGDLLRGNGSTWTVEGHIPHHDVSSFVAAGDWLYVTAHDRILRRALP